MVKLTEFQKEDIHILLKTFFEEKGLVRQHLDSYNEFIDHGLQEVVDEVGEIAIEVPENPYKVKLGQIWVIDPQSRITGPYATEVDGTKHEIYPMEGRLRNLAYAAPIALEMTPIIDGREQDTELVYIGCLAWKALAVLTTPPDLLKSRHASCQPSPQASSNLRISASGLCVSDS